MKEKFHISCSNINDKARAERFLQAWTWKTLVTGSRYLIRPVKMLRNWWREFLKHFDDRVTQGSVEDVNRATWGIINPVSGFRDFDDSRLRVLVECSDT